MIALHWRVKRMMCACFFVKIAVFSSAQLKSLSFFYINLLKLLTARILFASRTIANAILFSLFSFFYRITNKYKHKNRNYALHTNTLEHINLFETKKSQKHIQNPKPKKNQSQSLSFSLSHSIIGYNESMHLKHTRTIWINKKHMQL